MTAQPVTIILAEDDDGHAMLVQRNLARAGVVNGFLRVKDGQYLVETLFSEDSLIGAPVVLLDINMPRLDGVAALRQIKENPKTRKIPVIMLTTTDDPREVNLCYDLGCSVYITKPVEYDAFIEAIKRLGLFLQ